MVNGLEFPFRDPTSIGNLAIVKGYATKWQILEALADQKTRTPLIDKILLEHEILTEDQLEELLHMQAVKRSKSPSEITCMELKRMRTKAREATASLQETTCAMQAFATNIR